MAVIPDAYLDLLTQKKTFAELATVMPDGSPQVTPVWFDYTNGLVRVNTAKGRVKQRNMKEGSPVALSIMDPDNPYRYIQVRGKVTRMTEAGADANHAGCFSLYATKVITSGEGGAISTNDDELADKLRMMRNHGMRDGYDTRILGYNFRMPEVQAAIAGVVVWPAARIMPIERKRRGFSGNTRQAPPGITDRRGIRLTPRCSATMA